MWTIQREAPAIRSFALGRGLHINALPTYPNHNHNISLVPISARAEYRTGGLSMLDIICVYHMQISRHQTASRTRSEPAPSGILGMDALQTMLQGMWEVGILAPALFGQDVG